MTENPPNDDGRLDDARSATVSVTDAADGAPVSPNAIFESLADERRRYVLYVLHADDGQVEIDDVAEQVVARENRTSVGSLPEKREQRVRADLYHCHLPKLADHDVVEYDQDAGTVALAENASQIDHYVEFAKRVEQHEEFDEQA